MNDIELLSKALVDFDEVAAGLHVLQKTYTGVLYDVETPNGMVHAKAARAVLRKPRYAVETIRKAAKAPLLAIGRKLDAEAGRITAELLKLEVPIDQQIKNEEERREREQREKIEAEARRVAAIQARIEDIRGLPVKAAGKTAEHARIVLAEAESIQIDVGFAELAGQASEALHAAIAACKGVLAERIAFEAEQAKIVADRAELLRLRAEDERRAAAERARMAEEERQARAVRDAEAARQAEELRVEREALARQGREARAARAAEDARLAAERAELERQQEELRKAQEKQSSKSQRVTAARPTDAEIIEALAIHFDASEREVIAWLSSMKLEAAA